MYPIRQRRLPLHGLIACLGLFAFGGIVQAEWPQFRGPNGSNVADASNLPHTWNAFRNIAWELPLPGTGWSSPIVVGDRIWLTAAEATSLTDEERSQKLAKANFPTDEFQTHGSVTLYALEVDGIEGRLLRRIPLLTRDQPPLIHQWNSYASPTPATDGKRLYCHFGSLGTVALDLFSGQVVWERRLKFDEITGPGNSPILWQDLLVFACDGADEQFIVALDKRTGLTAWKSPRPAIQATEPKHKRAFSTPLVVSVNGAEQLVVTGAQWLTAHDPATGREQWRVNFGDGHAVVPMPVQLDGIIYFCTGYPKPQLWAVRANGQGDVTETHVEWIHDRQVPTLATPVAAGGEIYLVSALGVAQCLDARSGEQLWQERLGGNFAASPLIADGKVFLTNQEGTTFVLRASRKFELLGRNEAAGLHLASPAVYRNGLIFRGSVGLYYVRQSSN